MGIFDMFSSSGSSATPQPAQPQPPQSQAPAGNIPPDAAATGQASGGAAANGVIPPGTATSATPSAPLDQFADLWKNDPSAAAAASNGVFGDLDPRKFSEAAAKLNFASTVTPEQLQAISAGGEGAVTAFSQAMNAVAQATYAQSAFASTKLIEQALGKAKEGFMSELPLHIKKLQVSDNLRTENPIFANPAVQPVISALESQLTVKFPNASASEITAMAKQYVEALGTSFAAPATPAPAKAESKETDWSSFFS